MSGGVAQPRGLPGTVASPPRDGERRVSSRDSNARVRQGCREDQMEMGRGESFISNRRPVRVRLVGAACWKE